MRYGRWGGDGQEPRRQWAAILRRGPPPRYGHSSPVHTGQASPATRPSKQGVRPLRPSGRPACKLMAFPAVQSARLRDGPTRNSPLPFPSLPFPSLFSPPGSARGWSRSVARRTGAGCGWTLAPPCRVHTRPRVLIVFSFPLPSSSGRRVGLCAPVTPPFRPVRRPRAWVGRYGVTPDAGADGQWCRWGRSGARWTKAKSESEREREARERRRGRGARRERGKAMTVRPNDS